jgi:hypothetical protein
MGVYLIGVHLMGVYLRGVYLVDVYFLGRVSHLRVFLARRARVARISVSIPRMFKGCWSP